MQHELRIDARALGYWVARSSRAMTAVDLERG
jgi:hypothetical protein